MREIEMEVEWREESIKYHDTDRTENTSPNSSPIAASRGYRSDRVENTIPLLLLLIVIT
jgi:hypothetical protein